MSQGPGMYHPVIVPTSEGPAYELVRSSTETTRRSFESNEDDTKEPIPYKDEEESDSRDAMQNIAFEDEQAVPKQKRPWLRNITSVGNGWRMPAWSGLSWICKQHDETEQNSGTTTTPDAVPDHSSTAWLDGLRGVACLMVVFHHSNIMFAPFVPPGPTQNALFLNTSWLVNLPILRIWSQGNAMVAIFFVVSGFSISYSSLGHSRRANPSKVLHSLSSSVFRRWMRLYFPTITITFGDMLASYYCLYNGNGVAARHRQPPRYDDFSLQFWDWWAFVRGLSNPFQVIFPNNPPILWTPSYDPNVWTIPIEFQGSLVVFVVILGLCHVHRYVRLFLLTGLVWLLFHDHELNIVLFLGGTLLTELHYASKEWKDDLIGNIPLSISSQSQPQGSHRPLWKRCTQEATTIAYFTLTSTLGNMFCKLFWTLNFLLALYNISTGGEFWLTLSAMHLVLSIDNSKSLQAIFTTRPARFLGKISFSLYLIHGAFLHTLGWYLWTVHTASWIGNETALQHLASTTVAAIPTYAAAIIAARFLSWILDDKSVQLARWIWEKAKV